MTCCSYDVCRHLRLASCAPWYVRDSALRSTMRYRWPSQLLTFDSDIAVHLLIDLFIYQFIYLCINKGAHLRRRMTINIMTGVGHVKGRRGVSFVSRLFVTDEATRRRRRRRRHKETTQDIQKRPYFILLNFYLFLFIKQY